MRTFPTVLLGVIGLADLSHAFTQGTLIPAYFCSPANDNMPKALGQLIPLLQKDQDAPLAFNNGTGMNLQTVPMTNSTAPGNAGYIIASFHNTINAITPINQGMNVTLANNATAMVAGQPNLLVLTTNDLDPAQALDGALIYGQNSTGARSGYFVDQGAVFANFSGCGKNAQGQITGVIHTQLISDCNNYKQLAYVPPICGNGQATIKGLCVTDKGFGIFQYNYTVTGQKPWGSPDCKSHGYKAPPAAVEAKAEALLEALGMED